MDPQKIHAASPEELETLFCQPHPGSLPHGRFWGRFLQRVDGPGARRPYALVDQPFRRLPFGVDFDRCLWFFVRPRLAMGRFEPRIQPSRWRDTDVVALHYHVSALPAPLRGALYDEIKPLTADLCLGLGGLNGERGVGDHFFFALQRQA